MNFTATANGNDAGEDELETAAVVYPDITVTGAWPAGDPDVSGSQEPTYILTIGNSPAKRSGTGTVVLGGKTWTITVYQGDTVTAIATALVTAINADKLANTGKGGLFTAANASGVVTLTGADQEERDVPAPTGTLVNSATFESNAWRFAWGELPDERLLRG